MKNLLNSLFFLGNQVFLYCICVSPLFSQNDPQAQNVFINSETQQSIDIWNIKSPQTDFHSSFQPYVFSTLESYSDTSIGYLHHPVKNFFLVKTFNEGPNKRNQYNLQVLPIVDLQTGYDMLSSKIVSETVGGAHVKLNINNDFTFALTAIGGRVSYPGFIDTTIQSNGIIIPGLGRGFKNRDGSYNFSNLTGYVSYSPNRIFNFQLGKDKHFIGDGYRSLLLSDFSNNNPFFGINANIWRIQYNVWYSWMQDFSIFDGSQKSLQNKYGTFHYLSFNALKEFNISFFENVVWQGTDTNRVRTFDVNYLNPIVFYRPQEYSVGSADNSMMGLNASAKLFGHLKLYAQVVADEFFLKEIRAKKGWWANKQGWQFGAKYINAFKVKGLTLQVEYNQVRPYTYTHGSVQQNYANYGQALAHPFGANFKEYLGFVSYRANRWMLSLQGLSAVIGMDSLGVNMGQNIFESYTTRPYEYGHNTTQGNKRRLMQSDIKFTYYLIPQINLRLEVGYIQRSIEDDYYYNLQSPYIYFGVKTSVHRFYRDF
ncbi:MAG: capsule assembly Wzi family protein [Bacteroidota bacterium]